MPDPTNYVPGYDFSDYQASNPNKPLPADRLDDELHDISDALGGAITALKDIRRSDGNLVNKVVTYDALADDLRGPVYASEVYQRTHLNTLADLRNDLDLSYAILDVGARIQAGNYGFIVAPLAAADWHLKTAGDLLLYADVGSKAQAEQFGLATTNTAADNDAALARAAAWLNGASFRDLVVGQGRFEVSAQMPVITRSQVSFRGAGYEATSFRFPIGTTNGRFIQINTGLSAIARVSVGGFAIEYLATASMSGFAIDIDRASDVLVSDIRLVGAAGAVRVGSTAQCSRVTIDNIVGTFRDAFDHRVGVFTRWTGLQISNFTMYGDASAQRSVPTFDFTTVGICDTLDMFNVDCWSRAGQPYGIFVNADNGTFVNAILTNVIVDKSGEGTQGNRAAVWIEMTAASTASASNFWKIQNVVFYGLRADTGGGGGQAVLIRQGASNTHSAIRGIHFIDSDVSVRDSIGMTAIASGSDTIEDISVKGGFWKDAASGTIPAMFQMGVNRFSITGVTSGFAERNQTASLTNFVQITNAAIDEYVISGNMVYNITGALASEPTYSSPSTKRIFSGNSRGYDSAVDFQSRADAINAYLPADKKSLSLIHGGFALDYVRDPTGTALTTNGGTVNWSPAGDASVLHWGAINTATMASGGVVTGTDCTAQAQAMIDWVAAEANAIGLSGRRAALRPIKWGRGTFRVSGSLDFSEFGRLTRTSVIDMEGATIYADGAGANVFDFTDAEYYHLKNLLCVGSEATPPRCAVKTGRIANDTTAARWTISSCSTRSSTTLKSCFTVAALYQMASEECLEEGNIWDNGITSPTAYAAAYDSNNHLAYEAPLTITSVSGASPAVFSLTAHGLVTGDKIVCRDPAFPDSVAPGAQTELEGWAWTVTRLTADTFTLARTATAYNGSMTRPATVQFCKEKFAPSPFMDDVRPEPWKRHSSLVCVRDRVNYDCKDGRAAVYQGVGDRLDYRSPYLVGAVGWHFVAITTNAPNNLHWNQGDFFQHCEYGGGTDPDSWADFEALLPAEGTILYFRKCKFAETGVQAEFMFRTVGSTTVEFIDCDVTATRIASDNTRLFDDETKFLMVGGTITVSETAKMNLAAARRNGTTVTVLSTEISTPAVMKFATLPTAAMHNQGLAIDAGNRLQLSDGSGWRPVDFSGPGETVINNDANINVGVGQNGPVIFDTTVTTASRNRTFIQGLARRGDVVTFIRTGSGVGTLNIRDDTSATTIATLSINERVDIVNTGTNWKSMGKVTVTF